MMNMIEGRNYSNGFCLYSAVAGALSFFWAALCASGSATAGSMRECPTSVLTAGSSPSPASSSARNFSASRAAMQPDPAYSSMISYGKEKW